MDLRVEQSIEGHLLSGDGDGEPADLGGAGPVGVRGHPGGAVGQPGAFLAAQLRVAAGRGLLGHVPARRPRAAAGWSASPVGCPRACRCLRWRRSSATWARTATGRWRC